MMAANFRYADNTRLFHSLVRWPSSGSALPISRFCLCYRMRTDRPVVVQLVPTNATSATSAHECAALANKLRIV